ncbi:hypothetical protein FQN50_007067 [Emmonsiellopsis sp. PD_5]|nr:hypothetical protein FQN50_007067 [Emmonsiellopsis sp. PD_5]
MSSRTSTRQAAAKAKEALHQTATAGAKRGAGAKRKGASQEEVPKPKKERKEGEIEEQPYTEVMEEIPAEVKEGAPPVEQRNEENEAVNGEAKKEEVKEPQKKEAEPVPKEGEKKEGGEEGGGKEGQPEPEPQKQPEPGPEPKEKTPEPTAVKEASPPRKELPSNVLEKGIIYFFLRGKVSSAEEEPESMGEVARSFIVLRPLPRDAKIGEGTIGDDNNCRLLVLPKKVLPTTSKDRFMGFVEKGGTTAKVIRESFLAKETETATRGTRYTPAATPVAEGVYAITKRDRASHLVYHLTIPKEISDVQKDVGLKARGSFIASAKNPKFPGTANLPKAPEYPEEVKEQFGDLRWVPLEPQFIDYPSAQFLLIGGTHRELGTEEAGEEVETLEHENEVRAAPLSDDDTIYEDLGMSGKNYPNVATTWE